MRFTLVDTAESLDIASLPGMEDAFVGKQVPGEQFSGPWGQSVFRKPDPAVFPDIGIILIEEIFQGIKAGGRQISPGRALGDIFEVAGVANCSRQIDILMPALNRHLQFVFHPDAGIFSGEGLESAGRYGTQKETDVCFGIVNCFKGIYVCIHAGSFIPGRLDRC
jgi:hypothetical protein